MVKGVAQGGVFVVERAGVDFVALVESEAAAGEDFFSLDGYDDFAEGDFLVFRVEIKAPVAAFPGSHKSHFDQFMEDFGREELGGVYFAGDFDHAGCAPFVVADFDIYQAAYGVFGFLREHGCCFR